MDRMVHHWMPHLIETAIRLLTGRLELFLTLKYFFHHLPQTPSRGKRSMKRIFTHPNINLSDRPLPQCSDTLHKARNTGFRFAYVAAL
jgi:hypothetical protein